jgi:periplasmic divalent cation tolerance protein
VSSTTDFQAVIVLTTVGADADAAAIARTLVEERLAACVNLLPEMTSIYRWKGSVEQEREQQLVIKTSEACLAALEIRINELHPYDVPEFLVLRASDGSERYLAWMKETTAPV